MSFKDMVASDNAGVFMNTDVFAEEHTILLDGETYSGVKCVISQLKEQDRVTKMRDHAQGIYLVTAVLHCSSESLNGHIPEKGIKIKINDGDFFRSYFVSESSCDMGMIRVELEAIDE